MDNPFPKGKTLLNGSEKELSEIERYYRTLINSLNEDLLVIDREYRITDINNMALQTLGKTRQEVIGHLCYEISHGLNEPCDGHSSPCPLRQVFDIGEPVKCRHEHITSTGKTEHVDILASPIMDPEGNVSHVIEAIQPLPGCHWDQAEETLKESEARYMDLYENAPDMFASVNVKTALIEECNNTLANTLGYSKEEIIRRPVFDIYHPGCLEEAKEAFKFFAETGEIHDKELQLQRKDGAKIDVSLNVTSMRDKDGHILFSRSTLHDITARKRAEGDLRQSEARYRRLYNNTPVMLHSIDREGRLISVSDYWLTTLGYTRDEVLGCKSTEFLSEKSRRYISEVVLSEFMQTGHCHNIECQFVKKNGNILDCLLSAISERDTDGQVLRSMAVIIDITDQKRSISINMSRLHLIQFAETHSLDEILEETLNEVEKLTDSLIGFYHFLEDDQKTLCLQNWSTRTKAKFCKAEGKGLHYAISDAGVWVDCIYQQKPVIHNDYASLPHRKGMPEGHAEVTRELVVPVLRGERIAAILGIGNKPTDYNDTDIETVSLLADLAWEIAERKRAQEEIRRLNQELEQRVLDRTAQLEAANKELDAFAYTVSHDLRAPLRHIEGFLDLLRKTIETALDEQSRYYMDNISDSANKMDMLIDDLLSFSRMGRHALSFGPVDLGPLVRDVIRELEPDSAGRTITWRIGDLPTVDGEAALLRIVLDNLISNALKFTQPRQQAKIEIGSISGQASEVVIFVRDNGVGFDMDYADKLFGVFQRLHRPDEFEGTGIGLASVRRIIARHGGRTWAESKPDHSATFYFSLPQP